MSGGLAHAHSQWVIHRDIKPGNIHLTTEGDAQVTDFGIDRAMVSSSRVQQTYRTGTTLYRSPEQWSDGLIDHRADIYSLRVTLFEMLTGSAPFQGQSFQALYIQHRDTPVPPIPRHLGVPRAVGNVVRRAMAKSPVDRFADGEALAMALEAALKGAASREQRPGQKPVEEIPVVAPPEPLPIVEQEPQPVEPPVPAIAAAPPPVLPRQSAPDGASGRPGGGIKNWLMYGGAAASVVLIAVLIAVGTGVVAGVLATT